MSFEEGLVSVKTTNSVKWVQKVLNLPMVLAEKLGRTSGENDKIRIKQ